LRNRIVTHIFAAIKKKNMKKLIVFMHTSLDGFVAGPNGEMDWIRVDPEMFEYASKQTNEADTALYGRVTYDMMQGYWPTAGEQPNASKHDIEHSKWYNQVHKLVISKTLNEAGLNNTRVIGENIHDEISKIKDGDGKNIIVFGSPSVCHILTKYQLVDEYWLFINPVLLGQGIPMFKDISERQTLTLASHTIFKSGVACLHYNK
jgi:dihydrofolate reductase